MGDRFKGTEGFGIMRAFGAVAVLVALYGFSLSASALIDRPVETGAKRLDWFAPAPAATAQRSNPAKEAANRVSFWASTETTDHASPFNATVTLSGAASFWGKTAPIHTTNGSKLAGELERTAGRM